MIRNVTNIYVAYMHFIPYFLFDIMLTLNDLEVFNRHLRAPSNYVVLAPTS